jgi:diguanylate cyclase
MDAVLNVLSDVISNSDTLESFVRPLLELLESVSGLESTYLTTIDEENNIQTVLFARNSRELTIPEGIRVPWDDSLCKRAITENCLFADDVSTRWADSSAAKKLGIHTYMSAPVVIADGKLYGTLCGASGSKVKVDEDAHRLLIMFSRMIARQIEREQLVTRLRNENAAFQKYALTDPLTGITNRRGLFMELSRMLEVAQRSSAVIHVAFIDLDGFKQINDQYGHDAGDRFLIEVAARLNAGVRQADVVARYGGDEFVVFGLDFSAEPEEGQNVFRLRVEAATQGRFVIGTGTLDYPGASVGVVSSKPGELNGNDLISRADETMYRIKQQRKQKAGRQ